MYILHINNLIILKKIILIYKYILNEKNIKNK